MRRRAALAWSRVDQVATEVLLWLVIGTAVVLGTVRPLLGIAGLDGIPARRLSVTSTAGSVPDGLTATDPNVALRGVDLIWLEFADPSLKQRILLFLPELLGGLLVLVGGYLVLRIARTMRAREPFTQANIRRVLGLASLLIAGSFAVAGVEAVTSLELSHDVVSGQNPQAALDVPVGPVVIGVVILLLGAAFVRGAELRRDTEGLV